MNIAMKEVGKMRKKAKAFIKKKLKVTRYSKLERL